MGLEESYQVPPPCTTAACVPPGTSVVYERAFDQYGRPIVVVHQQPPPRTMSYANTNHNPPMQAMYPAHMQTYQPPYPAHTINPYATISTAQYPGQYAQPNPGTLLTSPGYYYMPASTQLTATAPTTAHVAPTSTMSAHTAPRSPVHPVVYPAPSFSLPHSTAAAPSLPVLAPLVSNTDLSNTVAHHVSNTDLNNNTSEHVAASKEREVTLPGLTPLVSHTDLQHVSHTDLSSAAPQQVSNTEPTPVNARASDTLTPVDPEPLVSFSNVTVTPSSLPGMETKFGYEGAKNSDSTVPPSEVKNSAAEQSPVRVKKSFNPLPRRQPTVKAYLAHEEL